MPTEGDGEKGIEDHRCDRNPNPKAVHVKLKGRADQVVVKVWTKSLVIAAVGQTGSCRKGWNRVPLPESFWKDAPNGLYYYTCEAKGPLGSSESDKPGKIMLAR